MEKGEIVKSGEIEGVAVDSIKKYLTI